MRPEQLRAARLAAGLTQQQAAARLNVSQAYLALIERGRRPITARVGAKIAKLYRLGPTALPLKIDNIDAWDSARLAVALAGLGYPGFRHLRAKTRDNPAAVVLAAIAASDVEVRVIEALPWIILGYGDLDWDWLIPESKLRDVQNRLGFLITLARRLAQKRGSPEAEGRLRQVEERLERARLVREDTLCQRSLTPAERRRLRRMRSSDARHWNLLTDLDSQSLPYAA